MSERADAVVIGAGPNGLVAANVLADAGWDVIVLEGNSVPGGAVRTAEITAPGFRNDLYSAFYPLGAASPVMRDMDLESHGLVWRRAGNVVVHPTRDGRCAVLSSDLDETCASLDEFAPGDGDAWRRLFDLWERIGPAFVSTLFRPFPPVRPTARMLRALGVEELVRFARFSLLPVRRLAEEEFSGTGGGLLLAGNALHADLTPDSVAGGLYGWLLCMLGQSVGFPVPEGGAGGLTDALVRRLEGRGGRIECDALVERIEVAGGEAQAVRTSDGRRFAATRGVLADVAAPALYGHLVEPHELPARLIDDLRRFQWDNGTVKVDWALSEPVPWTCEPARRAGTVHCTEGMDHLSAHAANLVMNRIPDEPFLVFGQYASFDPTRAPDGGEACWAYTHIPQKPKSDAGPDGLQGTWDERETEIFVSRMEEQVEQLAPGFRDRILARHVFTPKTMQQDDPNLVHGALNAGTAQLTQQLVFRPVPGLARPETPIEGLYLASASAHPTGGVHGACGANAAQAALKRGSLRGRAAQAAQRRISGW